MIDQTLAVARERAERNLSLAKSVVTQDYLPQLGSCTVLRPQLKDEEGFTLGGDVRLFRVTRLVQENREAVLESATAAYATLGAVKSSIFFYLYSTGQETNLYIGVRGASGAGIGEQHGALLQEVFRGHFPGSQLEKQDGDATKMISASLCGTMVMDSWGSVTAVTSVPGLSSEDRSMFIQGLEHFIDAAEGKRYQALILADPVSPGELSVLRSSCERLATLISPLVKTTTAYNQSESHSVAESLTKSINEGFSETVTEGENHTSNIGGSTGTTEDSRGRVVVRGLTTGLAAGLGVLADAMVPGGGLLREVVAGIGAGEIGNILGSSIAPHKTDTKSESWGESRGTNSSTSWAKTGGTSTSEGNTTTDGVNRGITHTFEQQNKSAEQFLKTIDYRLERLDEAHSYGGWNAAAYFVADTPAVSESLASTYIGLMRGVASGKDTHAITTWSGAAAELPRKWLGDFHHPRLSAQALPGMNGNVGNCLSPATIVSTREAAMMLSLPRRSASTLPVLQAEPFGRSIQHVDGTMSDQRRGRGQTALKLGCIRHLWEDMPQKIWLDREQLRTHAFVAGTTGSGKSNTLYLMLHQLLEAGIPFLVVEPAKGEYAQVFGGYEQVNCYDAGTGRANGLKLNPFRCPKELSLLEHIDRLTGIFCVCWPLYNAMPILLKEAVIVAYERAGWNVEASVYLGDGDPAYPDFVMLLAALEDVIAAAGYGERLQAEYTGALCTRVRSLTSGFSGRIFVADETGDEVLFDKAALVDLSRVGSAETRSLIMGMLVMRLVEYRQAQGEMNAPLRHVTVLEEAHNLLRAGATQGGDEQQGGVIGKSVEMITDAIAEMRTYGEGFVIVDQSPQAVHRAAIRNTGTKIALRLPDEEDRRVLGASIGLNDEQIKEMARLENGVAVVRQSGWLQAVLCHMDRFDEETLSKPMVVTGKAKLTSLEVKAFQSAAIKFLMWPWTNMASKPDITALEKQAQRWPDEAISQKLMSYIRRYEAGTFSEMPRSSEVENYLLAKLVTDIVGLRRQIALIAGRKQSEQDLDVAVGRLIQRHFRLPGTTQRQLTSFLLVDWAGVDNVDRTATCARWRGYISQDGAVA
ncbi:ATP-binding protein [Bombella favorum]|nr:ATP-binding protein [Bombella favorum]